MAGTLDHRLHVVLPGDLRELPERGELRHLRLVVGVVAGARTQSVAEAERHVVRLHDFADILEARVQERFLVMREAPLGHDRSAAADDARHSLRGERNVAEQHPGVNREIVHALLGLLDQRIPVDLPGQLFRTAIDLLQRLVDRHGPDRHWRVADDPLARLVDVLAGREIHHRIPAPARRPGHFLDFFLDRRGHRGIADVGIDLDQEITADDHRLRFRVVDVGGNDRAAARDFAAHELGRDEVRNRCAEALTRVLARHQPRERRPG